MTQTTHQQPDANDVLMGGGGAASATWETPGSIVGGRIVAKPQSYQLREFNRANPGSGALMFYPSGDPIMGIRVDVQTPERLNADDDGVRRIYVEKKRQLAAVRDAVRAVGETGIQMGGHLSMTWTGLEQGEGTEPAKTWAATYKPPTTGVPAVPRQGMPQQPPAAAYAPTQQQYAPTVAGQPVQPQYAPTTTTWPQPPAAAWPAPGTAAPAPTDDPWANAIGAAASLPAQAPAPQPTNVITETMAAAMRNAGVDTSLFSIVAG